MASDAELLAHRASGEGEAFGILADRHGPTLLRYAYAIVHDADDAQDVVQDTFVTAWRKRRHVRIVGDSALPWLLATCKNHASNLLRRRKRKATVNIGETDFVDTAPSPLEQVLSQEVVTWVSAGIAQLSPDMRTVVEACLLDDRSYQEVANDLGLQVATVSQRISRARKSMRARRDGNNQGVQT
ncbi:RNA polymerase sigma factor [Demequina sp.]|uniref:RNA polymerase sigma factor n=1 Tax=Demequina sp. TaxID=2050685 RepID=UPI003D0A8300